MLLNDGKLTASSALLLNSCCLIALLATMHPLVHRICREPSESSKGFVDRPCMGTVPDPPSSAIVSTPSRSSSNSASSGWRASRTPSLGLDALNAADAMSNAARNDPCARGASPPNGNADTK